MTKSKKTVPLGSNIKDTATIKVIGDNPRRKGSGPYKLYELMRRARTVSKYLELGGTRRWLPGAANRGFIKLGR